MEEINVITPMLPFASLFRSKNRIAWKFNLQLEWTTGKIKCVYLSKVKMIEISGALDRIFMT